MESECCGATLLHFENDLGICSNCKEWSSPEEEYEEERDEEDE
jgi:hypothetical protein